MVKIRKHSEMQPTEWLNPKTSVKKGKINKHVAQLPDEWLKKK